MLKWPPNSEASVPLGFSDWSCYCPWGDFLGSVLEEGPRWKFLGKRIESDCFDFRAFQKSWQLNKQYAKEKSRQEEEERREAEEEGN